MFHWTGRGPRFYSKIADLRIWGVWGSFEEDPLVESDSSHGVSDQTSRIAVRLQPLLCSSQRMLHAKQRFLEAVPCVVHMFDNAEAF